MKSLTEHNNQAWQGHIKALQTAIHGGPTPNGIGCPECGTELMDSTPNQVCASMPPQHRVHCPSCSYTGYRY